MDKLDRAQVDEHLREIETILRHIDLASRMRAPGGRNRPATRPYRLDDARADASRALAQLGQARHALLGTAAYLGTPGVALPDGGKNNG